MSSGRWEAAGGGVTAGEGMSASLRIGEVEQSSVASKGVERRSKGQQKGQSASCLTNQLPLNKLLLNLVTIAHYYPINHRKNNIIAASQLLTDDSDHHSFDAYFQFFNKNI